MVLRIGDKGMGDRATVRGHGDDEGGEPSRFGSFRFAETPDAARFRRRDILHRLELAAAEVLGEMIDFTKCAAYWIPS
jgi:hypothetical protein